MPGDPNHDIELITGARRLFVARHLNKPLLVELRRLNDKEAMIAMDTENRVRKDVSPYERALSYRQFLRSGHFNSQGEIANALKISPAQVSRVLRLAQLPTVIVKAFDDPTKIRESWGKRLIDLLEDPSTRTSLFEAARTLSAASERLAVKDVYRRLVAASSKGRKLSPRHHDVVVRGDQGTPLFRIRHRRDSIAFLLPLDAVGERAMRDICEALTRILQVENAQAADSAKTTRSKPPASVRAIGAAPFLRPPVS